MVLITGVGRKERRAGVGKEREERERSGERRPRTERAERQNSPEVRGGAPSGVQGQSSPWSWKLFIYFHTKRAKRLVFKLKKTPSGPWGGGGRPVRPDLDPPMLVCDPFLSRTTPETKRRKFLFPRFVVSTIPNVCLLNGSQTKQRTSV